MEKKAGSRVRRRWNSHAGNSQTDGLARAFRRRDSVPDPVSAHSNLLTVCTNSPIQLSATNDAVSPTNTYVYTWTATPVSGSGIPTNLTGTPQTVTPTVANTYAYKVTAFDAMLYVERKCCGI